MEIRWTLAAASDLDDINAYLKARHPEYRVPTMKRIYEAAQSLKQMPLRGPAGRVEGTRELLLSPLPYVIVYRVRRDSVEILRVYHTSRNR